MESRSNLVESIENQVHGGGELDNNHNGINKKRPPSNSPSTIGFECNICLDLANDPIVTLCGHLFCRSCLCDWLQNYSLCQECPVCKALVKDETLISLNRGNTSVCDLHKKPILIDRFGQSNHRLGFMRCVSCRACLAYLGFLACLRSQCALKVNGLQSPTDPII